MKLSSKMRENIIGYAFIAPSLLGLLIFIGFPVIFSLVVSFSDWDYTQGLGAIEFNFGKNYIEIWKDDWFLISLKNTFLYTIITVPVSIIASLIFAALIEKFAAFKNVLKLMFFMPHLSNVVALSIVWQMMLVPSGLISLAVKAFGLDPPLWLADQHWALFAIMGMAIWSGLGFGILIYSAAINGISPEYYEAADIDGAGEVKKFFRITVPMLSPTTFFLFIVTMISSFRVFGSINVMTQGGPGNATSVLVFYIYRTAFDLPRLFYTLWLLCSRFCLLSVS